MVLPLLLGEKAVYNVSGFYLFICLLLVFYIATSSFRGEVVWQTSSVPKLQDTEKKKIHSSLEAPQDKVVS